MPTDGKSLVLQATDIVELINQTVPLRRVGSGFVGLCPFHQEKTPSFHVSPAKQFFHCFGCKAGGNAIDFVMKRDRVEFREALQILADRAGVELPRSGSSPQQAGERQTLLEAHSAACRFFENLFWSNTGEAARQYMAKRGFKDETLKRFAVGMAMDSWDGLVSGPVGRKFGVPTLAAAGLVRMREDGRAYDTFRNRIIFPIRDEMGRIIAFGGRVMPGSDDPAKYLNSPESPLFSKGRCIFGLDAARAKIVESRSVAVVEGYTDVVMAHQYGVSNVVSVLGTAMTEQHVAVLRRYADRIVLLFDADSAGDAAAGRVVQLFLSQPVEIAVATMPDGLDPDEYVMQRGAEGFAAMLTEATDALGYAWKQLTRQYEAAGDLTNQQKAAQQYLELLAAARGAGPVDTLRWGAALARVSRLTDIPPEALHRRFRAVRPRETPTSTGPEAPVPVVTPPPPRAEGMTGGQERAERWLLGALLAEPARWQTVQTAVNEEDFVDEQRRRLASRLWDFQRHEGELVFSELLTALEDPALSQLSIELLQEAEALRDLDAAVSSAVGHFAAARRKVEERRLAARLASTKDQKLATEEEIELLRRLSENAAKPDTGRIGPRAGV